jgi:type I restriction enzyme S subunit
MAKEYLIGDFLKRIKRPIQLIDDQEYKLVTIKMNHNGVVLREHKKGALIKSKMYEVKTGDFILSGIDARNGAFGIVPPELDGAIVTNDFWYFEIDANIIAKRLFLELTATTWFDEICKRGSDGTTQRIRLQKNKFFNQSVMLPEGNEQKVLLDKILSFKSGQTKLDSEIQTQKLLTTQLKQSILQEAIQGKLTADWRAKRALSGAEVEPASELLKRIKAEKAQLIKDKKIKKEKPLPPITAADIPFELPEGWVWCRLGDISHLITKGSSPKWQGINYVDEGILFITSENVGTNEILLNKRKFVEHRFNEIEPRSILEKGDILTNIVGASIGRTAIWQEEIIANINQAVCLVRFPDSSLNKQYLVNILNSDFGISLMMDNQFDTGRGNLSLGAISKFKIPFPPIEEQKAIVEKVESLMQKCQALEDEIKTSEANAQMLMQAVLKETFLPAESSNKAGEGKKEVVAL